MLLNFVLSLFAIHLTVGLIVMLGLAGFLAYNYMVFSNNKRKYND